MSYATMDHARWVESNAEAAKKTLPRPRATATHGWHACPEKLTPLQARAMDILGMVYGGIYNAPIIWDRVHWQYGDGIAVPVRADDLTTFDFDRLTRLVFLCLAARIRGTVQHHGPLMFRLLFYPRSHAGGNMERHPNLEEAVAAFREYLPAEHRILYRRQRDDPRPARAEAHSEYSLAELKSALKSRSLTRDPATALLQTKDAVLRHMRHLREAAEIAGSESARARVREAEGLIRKAGLDVPAVAA